MELSIKYTLETVLHLAISAISLSNFSSSLHYFHPQHNLRPRPERINIAKMSEQTVFSKFWNPLQASNAETYYLKDRVLAYTFYSFLAIVLVTVGNYFFRFTHASMPLIMDPWHQLWLPILSIVPYVIMVHLLAPVFKGRAVRNQKAVDALWVPISKYWNLFLTILSFTMLFGLLHGLILDTIEFPPTSLSEVICNATNSRWNGTLSFWIWLFAMSKFIELFDTVILVVCITCTQCTCIRF